MKKTILSFAAVFLAVSCTDNGDTILHNEPVFVEHFRNGQYPDASYAGCQDTYMRSDSASSTYGTSALLSVYSSSGNLSRGLIRFSILGELPSDIVVKKAVITLYFGSSMGGAGDPTPDSVAIDAVEYYTPDSYVTPSWEDFTWTTGNSLIGTAIFDTDFNNYGEIEIPAAKIKLWQKNVQLNWGMVLKVADESFSEGLFFSSSDDTDINQRPMLTIYYTY
jgi:hypothetical protein